jgi:hypothetical protein
MEQVEQENTELHGQVSTLQAEVERLSALVSSMVVAQNKPTTPPPQATVISEIVYSNPRNICQHSTTYYA